MPRASQTKKKSKGVSKGPSVTVAPLEKSMAEVAEEEWEKVDVEEEVKKKPIRVKTSSFHITINSNQRYGSKDALLPTPPWRKSPLGRLQSVCTTSKVYAVTRNNLQCCSGSSSRMATP